MAIKTVKMLHPRRKDQNGNPFIQLVNERTYRSGKAEKMGYILFVEPSAPPVQPPAVTPVEPDQDDLHYSEPAALEDETKPKAKAKAGIAKSTTAKKKS